MKSLGSRLTLWYVLVVMTTMASALVFGHWLLNREMMKGIDLLNAAEFQEIPMRAEAGSRDLSEAELLSRVASEAKLDAALYLFQVRNARGDILYRSENMGSGILPPNPSKEAYWTGICESVGPVRVSEFPMGPLKVQVASPLHSVDRLFRSYVEVGVIMLGMVLVVSIFFGLWLKRLALDPIRRIQQTATRISADNLSERIPVGDGNDEVSDLARLLNQMFNRLEKSFFQLWRFAGNASHELKTPLSIIRLQSEKLLMQGSLSGAQQESVQQQLESISRLTTVIEKLLFLARSEVMAIDLNLKTQCTGALIKAFSEDAVVLCEEAKVELVIAKNIETQATFDAALLRQVLLNLLSNAIRFTPAGGKITISSWTRGDRWLVSVEDTGPGLPPSTIEEVFEPFVRVGTAVSAANAQDGAGLGLAICRSILLLHHGDIHGENRDPGPGFRVIFDIPCIYSVHPPNTPSWVRPEPAGQYAEL